MALLPPAMLLVMAVHCLGRSRPAPDGGLAWRSSLLKAALVWGALVLLIAEGLSLFAGFNRFWVATAWSVALIIAIAMGWRSGALIYGLRLLRRLRLPDSSLERIVVAAIVVLVLALLLIARVSPPNNNDSLQYHMSRVAHWIQQASLDHYAAAYHPQLWSPPWAEIAILHLRVLSGGDQLANMVQWFSMVVAVLGVSELARESGANRLGQLLAAAFALSIPMGILQATSTQTDFVAAMWLVCLGAFILRFKHGVEDRLGWLWPSLALGLGVLTKGIFYPLALPFLLWWFLPRLSGAGFWRVLREGLGLTAIVVALNAGFWLRNLDTYGGLLGPRQWITDMTNSRFAPADVVASVVNQVALNYATPSETANEYIIHAVRSIPTWFGRRGSPFQLLWSWNHEDLAGAPLHFLMVPISLTMLLLWRRRGAGGKVGYAIAAFGAFLLFSAVVGFDLYGARHHLPFLVIWSPVIGVIGSQSGRERWVAGVTGILLVAAMPWVLLNRTRPLIGWYPRTATESILTEPGYAVLLANWPELRDPYVAVASKVRASGCSDVGLRIDSHDLEYAFWWLLGAPESGRRIEIVEPLPSLQRYLDPDFQPCAIICTICSDERTELHGLELDMSFEAIKLYLAAP